MELGATGVDLLGNEMAIVAAGERDRGGAAGVGRELLIIRSLAQSDLGRNGRPRYRFVGLLDNDPAGREAVRMAHALDSTVLEYKDVFLLRPWMAKCGSREPKTLRQRTEERNKPYAGLRWELEDLVSKDFVQAFMAEHPTAVIRQDNRGGRIHTHFTPDGKAKFHRFIRQHAIRDDVADVVDVIQAMRFVLGLS
jgi:hypothetical protein